MSKHHSSDYKLAAVKYYIINKIGVRQICKIFKCKRESLRRWIVRYLQTGSVDNKPRKQGSYKIRKKHVNFILNLLTKKPDIMLWQILAKFHKKFNITLSKGHLVNIIRYANLTYKKYNRIHRPDTRYNIPINYKQEYKKFYDKIKQYSIKDIICIDETSISVGIHIDHCRTTIGKRCKKITKSNEIFKKYTLIMAIDYYGVVGWKLYRKSGIDSNRYIDFLNKHILTKYKNKLVLMDNASSHRNQKVKDTIINATNDYVYILPYQYGLNTIERFFNQLKHYMKLEEPMNFDEIKRSIGKSIKMIKKENYINYFKGTYNKKNIIDNINLVSKYHKKPKIYKD
jgi:transposase